MKNIKIVFAIVAMCLFASCASIHKVQERHRERTAVKTALKKETEGHKVTDSLSRSETATIGASTVTTSIDTDIVIPGQVVAGEVDLPDTGETVTFSDEGNTTQVTRNSRGKLDVKTTTKEKVVPVKQNRTEISLTASNTKTETWERTEEHTKATEKIKVDSTAHRQFVSKDKTVNRVPVLVGGAICFLILAVLLYLYKKYCLRKNNIL